MSNRHHRITALLRMAAVTAALGFMACPVAVNAHEPEGLEEAAGPNQGKVSFSAGLDITNAYFFRGILQEDQGMIYQPSLEAAISLTDTVGLNFGIWNSFHDAQTGAASNGTDPDSWYEADLYAGMSFALGDHSEMGLTYTAYTSPNDAFNTIHEIAVSFSCDDAAGWEGTFLEGSGLQPSVTVALELDNTAFGPDEGTYLEVGVSPSMTLIESQDSPITLTVPITVGLSLSDYYGGATNDPNFGFLDIGADLSMPISAIPADYGSWEATVGVHYLMLSENTELANNGDESEFIVRFGISMGY